MPKPLHGDATPDMTRMVWVAERELLSIAAAIACDDMAESLALADSLRASNNEFNKAVKGNRPGNTLLTWRDLRTIMANYLRSTADALEGIDGGPAPLPDRDD